MRLPAKKCGLVGVSETCSTLHQQGCSLTVSRGHYLVVLTSFVNLSTATDQIKSLDFHMGRLIENVRLIISVTRIRINNKSAEQNREEFKSNWEKIGKYKKLNIYLYFEFKEKKNYRYSKHPCPIDVQKISIES